jgi:hypothetical protein
MGLALNRTAGFSRCGILLENPERRALLRLLSRLSLTADQAALLIAPACESEPTIAPPIQLAVGDVAWLPKGVPHSWAVHGTETASFLPVTTTAGMEEMFRDLAALPADAGFAEFAAVCCGYGIEFA